MIRILYETFCLYKAVLYGDFLDDPVVKNPPTNAGDTGSIPVLGRFHMLRDNEAQAPQLLSLWRTATEVHSP